MIESHWDSGQTDRQTDRLSDRERERERERERVLRGERERLC